MYGAAIDQEKAVLDKPRLDPLTYRDAMSRLAAHVQVVTAEKDGERRGVTITAACSVSDSPPTLLVCLNGANPRNAIFSLGGSFALNVLSADETEIAHAFSGRDQLDPALRFSKADWTTLETGAPVLASAVAAFDCRIVDIKTVATHVVIFGEVVGVKLGDKKPALLYLDRGYRTL
ncbi:flavin reductase [Pararhizobium antarcticum]|uniref:4-hydroxyphenylacetate 3-monooxygenase n=1 Tax=Pararhizobium antarcticum TaxID=1798805 RepID=A0A657LNH9_9HYPH|nr:flavin reductase [Pararhizobium antarcticum]OJF93360.1 4-hydroxyphenylacetate 3-monooxygenase [Pararhizobium antarcticum]OJF96004.1 4-hydroxyphenylacetate 3-monooxygenase [Rhizobium sp. 58]